ncbi:uncharacterized protein LOC122528871 [Frieseomelitta varia]|uniref:uncharacterized protein LOC122528871 n=1 Tax=Frieseomelitta varia TaxID=561572 RepID=UPI001CB6A1A0|nr:uncharacterized protein LOC122528871 [Frieseomelitta varia]
MGEVTRLCHSASPNTPTTMKFARQNRDAILVMEIVVFRRFDFLVVRDIILLDVQYLYCYSAVYIQTFFTINPLPCVLCGEDAVMLQKSRILRFVYGIRRPVHNFLRI